ncbi:VOC family protein [Herbidospora sp. NBRC 101105]|uniref:VOC family protein n=1 Tax=Herbidospora sp. NBRC 101105 TaxID=3032195 RepID=UPI0024A07DC1|nr:VOC family protein [Herbidospora sp. NBRC 101105]GLX96882.1 hydroxylase [Herbidospora sp. NBRC 101105]
MSEFRSYAPGVPCWVDVSTPDIDASTDFYTELFGWTAVFDEESEDYGGYGVFHLHGKYVAGIGPVYQEGMPAAWNTYICTDDVAKTTETVRENGGTIVTEPVQIMNEGRMAGYLDPAGAYICAWQPIDKMGAQLANEPGTLNWSELITRDTLSSTEFYGDVFGWTAETRPMGDMEYTTFAQNGHVLAGMMAMPDALPAEIPSYWLAYLGVDNLDAAVQESARLGATQMVGPTEVPGMGNFAIITDPAGAAVGLWESTP